MKVEKLEYKFDVNLVKDFSGKEVICSTYFDEKEVLAAKQYFDKPKLTKETLTRRIKKELIEVVNKEIIKYTSKRLKKYD